MQNLQIRETKASDFDSIMHVEESAFGSKTEAGLTADLLADATAKPILSLLAYQEEKAIGHILFTRAYLDKMDTDQSLIHILAPLAVVPTHQKKGIGGLLINNGLERLKDMGSELIFVLGHMNYYPKFGFIPNADKTGYKPPYPLPKEHENAWMVQSLNPDGFVMKKGKVICADQLNKPEYWRE